MYRMSAAALLNSSGKLAAEYFAYPAPVSGTTIINQPAGAATTATATVNVEPGYYMLSNLLTFSGAGATAGSFGMINVYKSAGTATIVYGGEISIPSASLCLTPSTSDATKTTAQVLSAVSGNYWNTALIQVGSAGTITFSYVPVASMNYGAAGGQALQLVRLSQ